MSTVVVSPTAKWPFLATPLSTTTSPFFGPAVGSNPFGVEGYKTLAYEVAEALGWQVPDWCVLPVCYGDALYGMWKGFEELRRLGWIDRAPRLVAAEIHGSLGAALADGGDAVPEIPGGRATLAASIGATRSTFQALTALRKSGASSDHWSARRIVTNSPSSSTSR